MIRASGGKSVDSSLIGPARLCIYVPGDSGMAGAIPWAPVLNAATILCLSVSPASPAPNALDGRHLREYRIE